jgi:hypothetical protein
MNLDDLTDEETAALARLLSDTINGDRFPLSPRVQVLKAILTKIQPEPPREPLPPLKNYAPPRATTARRRRRAASVEIRTGSANDPGQRRCCARSPHRVVQGLPPSGRP